MVTSRIASRLGSLLIAISLHPVTALADKQPTHKAALLLHFRLIIVGLDYRRNGRRRRRDRIGHAVLPCLQPLDLLVVIRDLGLLRRKLADSVVMLVERAPPAVDAVRRRDHAQPLYLHLEIILPSAQLFQLGLVLLRGAIHRRLAARPARVIEVSVER